MIVACFRHGAEMAHAIRDPKLAGSFEAALFLPTGRLHVAGANRPAAAVQALVVHAPSMTGKIVLFSLDHFARWAAWGFQSGDRREHWFLFSVAGSSSPCSARPNPPRYASQCRRRQIRWVALPADNDLLVNHSASARSVGGLVPADNTRRSSIRAIPRGFAAFSSSPSPARAGALASRPASAPPGSGGRALRLRVPRAGFPSCSCGLGFGTGAQTLGQGVQRRVDRRDSPLLRQSGGFLIGGRGRDGKGQLVLQCQTELLVAGQSPVFAHRTAPMSVGSDPGRGGHFQFNHPGDGAQLHRAVAPMHQPAGR